MRYLLILLALLASPAFAQSVSVKSGEHGAFTRLVLTFPTQVGWVLGRTEDGYGLQIDGPGLPYDLSSVYRLITKDRLRSIWVDPESGRLLLGIDCACHAIPFEFGPKILVIDIKDGPPPSGSSFEVSLTNGISLPPIRSVQPIRPRRSNRTATVTDSLASPVYDWRASTAAPEPGAVPAATNGLATDVRLERFRAMLIDEVGRGATQGVVEMERPTAPRSTGPDEVAETGPKNSRAAVNGLPGLEISSDRARPPDLTVQGDTCPKSADLDFSQSVESEDVSSELSRVRAALLSEFDMPNPDKVADAVDVHLFFGFGAEARLLLSSFLPQGQTDRLRTGLSYIVDGETPADNPFENMQSCDSTAALWAILAAPKSQKLPFGNGAAVSRSFLALPTPLRAFLGPETARRLMMGGDAANAEVVRRSFERAAPDDPSLGLLAADQALLTGDPAGAEAALPTPSSGMAGETAIATLITRVEARFQQRKAVDGKDILALEAFAFEHGTGPFHLQLNRALSHAAALGGDFATAFLRADQDRGLEQDIWMLLAETGPDSQLLAYAVGRDSPQRMALPPVTRTKIAGRLLSVGLPNAASEWVPSGGSEADLAARVALADGNARAALQALATRLPDVDTDLLAASYTALGDFSAAASTYQQAGRTAEAARASRWARTWPSEPDQIDDPWTAVAALLTPSDPQAEAPPLQAAQQRLDQSAATRQAIADLMAAAPMVAPP